jgi:purple acid phosphatase-like protein
MELDVRYVMAVCLIFCCFSVGCGGDSGENGILPLEISGVQVDDIKSDSAVVTWRTSVKTQSLIGYGKSTNYALFAEDEEFRTVHSMKLTGLEPETEYHYEITGFDTAGNSVSDFDRTFFTVSQ